MVLPRSRPVRVLLVEDDPALAASLTRHLERGGLTVVAAGTERDAIRRASESFPDVVLLDLALAEGSGAAVCRQLRASDRLGDVPILVLSGRATLASKAELFSLGADDYLVKPFDPAELLLRVDALLRRRASSRDVRRIGRLTVATSTGDAWIDGRIMTLTAAERLIMSELARSWPGLAPRDALVRAPWRDDLTTSENVVEVLVGRLRRKIAAAGGGVTIRSVRRSGYVLEIRDDDKHEIAEGEGVT
jgi:DNA-binding response OmpR family regulator